MIFLEREKEGEGDLRSDLRSGIIETGNEKMAVYNIKAAFSHTLLMGIYTLSSEMIPLGLTFSFFKFFLTKTGNIHHNTYHSVIYLST